MAYPESRTARKHRRRLTLQQWLQIAVVALLVLGGGAFAGWRWWQASRFDHAVRDAQDFLRLGDPRSAVFAAKRALQVRETSVDAARLLAEALEKTGSLEAVVWRRKLVDLAPGVPAERVALAQCALRFGDAKVARSALEAVDAAARNDVEYLRTAADVALGLGEAREAERLLSELLRLNPFDQERQLKLALLQISSEDEAVAEQARARMEQMKDDPALRLVALRVLVRDAVKRNAQPSLRLELSATAPVSQSALREDPRLRALAEELLSHESATVDDCRMALEVLREMRGTDFVGKLARLQTAQFSSPANLGDAMLWLTQRGFADQTVAWTEKLTDELRTRPEVQIALADAYIAQKEWGLVQAIVEETEWPEFEAERLLISAMVWRLEGDKARADASWSLAELRMEKDARRIQRLADLSARWGAEPEKEKLWWKLASCPGDQSAVLKRLFEIALKRKDSVSLYRAVKGLHEQTPDDPSAMNNYAWLSLLRQEDLATAHRLAERVFAADPKIGAYASTYAFSLHLRGRTAEGIAVLEAVPSTALRDPTVAGCYGYLLSQAGQNERAQIFLGAARRSPDLLPEESRLFLSTGARIDRSMEVPDLEIFSKDA